MSRAATFVAAAVVLACIWFGVSHRINGLDNAAFADALAQIQKARTIAWKTTTYRYTQTGKDEGKWIKTEEERAYKAPDVYREVRRDARNQIEYIRITDHSRDLFLYPRTKKASLEETAMHYRSYGPRGPFVYDAEAINRWQWAGTRKTTTGAVNIFRYPFGPRWSVDLWVDQRTKRIVRHQVPGADVYDPENDPDHNNPIGKYENWPNGSPICTVDYDISYDADLDDSLFSFEPPEGYKLTLRRRNYVTEREMIDYIGILVDLNGGAFPTRTHPDRPQLDEPDLRSLNQKPEAQRTPAEKKFLEAIHRSIETRLNCGPMYHFITDRAVEGSFMYVGKGVKLGDKDRIVCWYKLKNAENPRTFRAVYGDLSVKDVAPEDLPLDVQQ